MEHGSGLIMRISYRYRSYPNCPRATDYSKSSEEFAVSLSIFITVLSLAGGLAFVLSTFDFFGAYDWGEYFQVISFVLAVGVFDFYCIVCRQRRIERKLKYILLEESQTVLPSVIENYKNTRRDQDWKDNWTDFKKCSFYFIDILLLAMFVIGTIKGVYFVCHKENGSALLLISITAVVVLSFVLIRMYAHQQKSFAQNATSSNDSGSPYTEVCKTGTRPEDEIRFCSKCGAKVFPDSIYCSKCGNKVR